MFTLHENIKLKPTVIRNTCLRKNDNTGKWDDYGLEYIHYQNVCIKYKNKIIAFMIYEITHVKSSKYIKGYVHLVCSKSSNINNTQAGNPRGYLPILLNYLQMKSLEYQSQFTKPYPVVLKLEKTPSSAPTYLKYGFKNIQDKNGRDTGYMSLPIGYAPNKLIENKSQLSTKMKMLA